MINKEIYEKFRIWGRKDIKAEIDKFHDQVIVKEFTNAVEAKRILADSGVAIIPAESIQDAATKAVNAALAI